jgi:hypothetical protein
MARQAARTGYRAEAPGGGPVKQRDALIEAHRQAAACIRQHVDSAIEGVAADPGESDKIAASLEELAQRHDRAAERMTATGSSSPEADRG